MSNISLNIGFTQVCVWPGTIVENTPESIQEFVTGMSDMFNVRVQFLECIYTYPDYNYGIPVPGTGGRCDLFFSIHNDDVMSFAVPRLQYGIRWIEDVLGNGHGNLYPPRVTQYASWPYETPDIENCYAVAN